MIFKRGLSESGKMKVSANFGRVWLAGMMMTVIMMANQSLAAQATGVASMHGMKTVALSGARVLAAPAVRASDLTQDWRQQILAAKRIRPEQAIAAAQQVKPGRVLSVNQVQQNGKTVYRVKILGANGRVSTVSVDATTGQVIK